MTLFFDTEFAKNVARFEEVAERDRPTAVDKFVKAVRSSAIQKFRTYRRDHLGRTLCSKYNRQHDQDIKKGKKKTLVTGEVRTLIDKYLRGKHLWGE